MADAKHTPGPWVLRDVMITPAGSPKVEIAEVGVDDDFDDEGNLIGTSLADGLLIAAAPELLAALQGVLDDGADESETEYDNRMYRVCTSCQILGDSGIEHLKGCAWESARIAIAKATGSAA